MHTVINLDYRNMPHFTILKTALTYLDHLTDVFLLDLAAWPSS